MFISDSHMPQVLTAEAYHSQEQHQRELETLFRPAWHFVGSTAEIPREGDYLTQEVLGHPLLIWNSEGEIHAFLNVCAHRACMLTHQPSGCTRQLKCQYHGWEYDKTGKTRKIPDARSFRPLKPGVAGLHKFPCETVGGCIFVSLADEPEPLRDFLGPAHDLIEEISTGHWEFHGAGDREMDADWKVYIENTIETYHVETVHPKSLREIPDEETCAHEFDERWSLLKTFGKPENLATMDALAHKVLGAKHDPDYHNLLVYPHLVVGKMSLFGWVDQVLPIAPGRLKIIARGFSQTGRHGRLRAGLMRWLVRTMGGLFMRQIVSEDAAVLPAVQRGLRSPRQPQGGLISIREERIFHFQEYVRRKTTGECGSVAWDAIRAASRQEKELTTDCAIRGGRA